MKHSITMLALLATATAFAGGHIESACYPPDGTIWKFEIYTNAKDQWDSSKSEHPPLSPKKVKDLATAFMKQVPLGDKMVAWDLSKITLKKMSSKPEHWIYTVNFNAVPNPKLGPWNGPVPWFEVLVRMDGSIPEPKIEKRKKNK
jgi:hypothetical protein